VVAERGPIKFSRAPVAAGTEEDGNGMEQRDEGKGKKWKGKGQAKEEIAKPSGKKYVNFKLIDFGSRSQSSSSGGKAVIRGDAFLSLLLFESDRFDLVTEEEEKKPRKVYKGGSRGAYEALTKVKEGDVIVLLNPRILKPFQVRNYHSHGKHY
jgi:minichromosome maintenance protein 10